jgi:hypothetical protein
LELFLFDPVISYSDNHNDADGNNNGGTVDPTMLPAILVDTDCHRKDSSNAQDPHDSVIEAFNDHITDGSDSSFEGNVSSIFCLTLSNVGWCSFNTGLCITHESGDDAFNTALQSV